MQAIPTTYAGTRFRSRLEADWASTLDGIGMPWHYEPEGYQLSDGTWYAPDFWLPTAKAWLEVKGDHDQRISKLEQFAADLWRESGTSDTYAPTAPMVLIGRAPNPDDPRGKGDLLPNPIGVMGHGKRYSVMLVWCPACNQKTVIALWQPLCRNCQVRPYENPLDWWSWKSARTGGEGLDGYTIPWRRVPRQFGAVG